MELPIESGEFCSKLKKAGVVLPENLRRMVINAEADRFVMVYSVTCCMIIRNLPGN